MQLYEKSNLFCFFLQKILYFAGKAARGRGDGGENLPKNLKTAANRLKKQYKNVILADVCSMIMYKYIYFRKNLMKKILRLWIPALAAVSAAGVCLSGCRSARDCALTPPGSIFENTIRSAKDRVFPAVVYILVLREDRESGKDITATAAGSGVFITPDGEIITNHHVVDKAVNIRCLLSDGQHFEAEVIGSDKDIDLALIRLKDTGGKVFPYAEFAGNPAKEGDFVMAMGAPYGLSRSVTMGIISSARRYLDTASNYSLWYQTDAAIFPGNSGGPLVNTAGKIIGINTRGMVSGKMGFSIPAETVRILLPRFRQYRQANWAWTGIELQPLQDFLRNIYFDGTKGVIVAGVEPESPGSAAGIQVRDRILKLNGEETNAVTIEDIPGLKRRIGLLPFGEKAVLTIERSGKVTELVIVPEAKGSVEGDTLALPEWGITVRAVNRFANPDLYYYCRQGVYVLGADSGNTVAEGGSGGLRVGDVILSAGGVEIKTLADLREAAGKMAEKAKKDNLAVIEILRNGSEMQIVLDFSKVVAH